MNSSNNISAGILKSIGILVAISIGLFFLYQIQTIIVYLIISILLVLLADPVVNFFKKIKCSHTWAVSLTLILFLLLIIGLFLLFVPLIVSQSENLSLLDSNTIKKNTSEIYIQIGLFLANYNINLNNIIKETHFSELLNFNFFSDFFTSIIEAISNFGMGLVSVFFITFFFLKDKTNFVAGFKQVLPSKNQTKILESIYKVRQVLSKYFIGLILQLTIILILYLIVLLIFGVENAFVIAFLCALLNIVPYVGPLIGAALAGVLTLLGTIGTDFQTNSLPTTIYVIIGFCIVQIIDNNVSSPIIFSKSLNSHPLEIFLIILIIGTLFGITGMIIAIPFYTILKVIAKEFYPENKIIKLLTQNN